MLAQSPLQFFVLVLLASLVAGFGGSLIGLGGAILMTPILTIFFGVPIRLAIGASVVSIIATSSGAAAAYVRDHITNLRGDVHGGGHDVRRDRRRAAGGGDADRRSSSSSASRSPSRRCR
jgi:hypothetical protein